MIKTIIVGKTNIDWNNLLLASQQVLGRSISKTLDDAGLAPKVPVGLLTVLSELKSEGSKPMDIMNNPGFALDHVSYSILCLSLQDSIFDVMQYTELRVVTAKSESGTILSYITGTLGQWRSAIINGLSKNSSKSFREFLDSCLLEFDKEGLSPLFNEFDRVDLADKTFTLRRKKT